MDAFVVPALIVIALSSLIAGLAHRHERTKWVFVSIAFIGFVVAIIPFGMKTHDQYDACEENHGYYSCQNDFRPWIPLLGGAAIIAAEAAICGYLGSVVEKRRRPTVGSKKRYGHNSRRFQV